jgi:antitoxin (DNA-binding transcriptional repressor) of toxin-antitoxin stability system
VEDGEEIVITRDGKPVARLVPDTLDSSRAAAAAANLRIRARAAAMNVKFDWEEFKRDRDEGRP